MSRKPAPRDSSHGDALYERIRLIWESVRNHAARSVNTAHVYANWLVGCEIVEDEQGGQTRATYGAEQLRLLSERLSAEFGTGFSVSALQYMRAFYLTYPGLLGKQHAVRVESCNTGSEKELAIRHALRDVLSQADKHKQIFASRYQTCLPSEEDLRIELRREMEHLPLTKGEA